MTKPTNGRTSAFAAGLVFVALFAATVSTPSSAEEAPRIQVFGGYSRLQFDSKSFGFGSNTGLNGGAAAAAFNLTPRFGVVGEIHVQSGPNIRSRDWLIGPQFMYNKWGALFYAHALLGKEETRVITSVLQEDNGKAYDVGGGVDYKIMNHLSLRVVQVDYLKSHTIGADQNNIRFSTGLVFHLWKVSSKPRHKL